MMIGTYAILMFEKDQVYINQRRASQLVQRPALATPAAATPAAGLASVPSP
jgi:hypothetical protein